MANVPTTIPALVISGCDQEARRPWLTASARYSSGHRGSVVTSAMMTRSLRNAAVPQAPRSGPIVQGLMAGLRAVGKAGPPPGHSRFPSGSIRRTVDTTPGVSTSIVRHSSSSTSGRPTPLAISPIARFSAADSALALSSATLLFTFSTSGPSCCLSLRGLSASHVTHGRVLCADTAECEIVVLPAKQRIGAENVHVARLDEIVAGLLYGGGRIEIPVRAQQPGALAADRHPGGLDARGLRRGVNQATEAFEEAAAIGRAIYHDCVERGGGIEQDAGAPLDCVVDVDPPVSQGTDDAKPVGLSRQHDRGVAGLDAVALETAETVDQHRIVRIEED